MGLGGASEVEGEGEGGVRDLRGAPCELAEEAVRRVGGVLLGRSRRVGSDSSEGGQRGREGGGGGAGEGGREGEEETEGEDEGGSRVGAGGGGEGGGGKVKSKQKGKAGKWRRNIFSHRANAGGVPEDSHAGTQSGDDSEVEEGASPAHGNPNGGARKGPPVVDPYGVLEGHPLAPQGSPGYTIEVTALPEGAELSAADSLALAQYR